MTATRPGSLSEREYRTLGAIADALLPAIPRANDPGGLFAQGAAALQSVDRAAALIGSLPDPRDRLRLGLLLRALDSRVVNFALGGRFARFGDLATDDREALLRGWAFSRLPARRAGFQALKRLCPVAPFCWPPPGRPPPPGAG